MKYSPEKLQELQKLSLEEKIQLSSLRITEWYTYYNGNVCVAFSGGKDSTVLLHLVRSIYPEVPAVYIDTRLDYPEVREHVMNTENVIHLKPRMNFREVIDTYGYPFPSKEVAQVIDAAKRGVTWGLNRLEGKNNSGVYSDFKFSIYNKWKKLVDLPVKISDRCCDEMKEIPMKNFLKESGLKPFVGIMATESIRRRNAWLQVGCNAFNTGQSKPLSFWTEQDILQYIKENNIKIPSVYGNIVEDKKGKLKLTGCNRTGCVFCPIGSHLAKKKENNKFLKLKESHPNLYEYCMKELGLDEFLTQVGVEH